MREIKKHKIEKQMFMKSVHIYTKTGEKLITIRREKNGVNILSRKYLGLNYRIIMEDNSQIICGTGGNDA